MSPRRFRSRLELRREFDAFEAQERGAPWQDGVEPLESVLMSALIGMGPCAIAPLLEEIQHWDQTQPAWQHALAVLREIDRRDDLSETAAVVRALGPLAQTPRDSRAWRNLAAAAGCLAATAASAALSPLVAAFDDGDPETRSLAVKSVGALGVLAIPPVLAALDSEREHVRAAAIAAIAELAPLLAAGDERQLEILEAAAAALADRSADVRRDAARALSVVLQRLVGADALPASDRYLAALVRLLDDPDERVRAAGAFALADLGPGAIHAEVALVALRRDPSIEVRQAVIFALVKLKSSSSAVIDAFAELLTDDSAEIRRRAAMALHIEMPRASTVAGALIQALRDDDPEVRLAAANALSPIARSMPEIGQALLAAQSDQDPRVRQAALDALQAAGS